MERQVRVFAEPNALGRNSDRGFTLVEIVVSMFLIGIIAVSVLPVLIQALKASAVNITIATSTQMINDQMDAARGAVGNCAQLQDFLSHTPAPVTDPQRVVLQATRTGADECSDAKLGAATLTITITRGDTGAVVSAATTLLSVLASAPAASESPAPSPSATAGP